MGLEVQQVCSCFTGCRQWCLTTDVGLVWLKWERTGLVCNGCIYIYWHTASVPFLIFYTFLIPFLLDRCQPSSSGKTSSSAGASCSRCLEAFEVFLLHRSLLLDQTENSLPGTIDVVLESMRRIRQLVCFPFCLSLICLSWQTISSITAVDVSPQMTGVQTVAYLSFTVLPVDYSAWKQKNHRFCWMYSILHNMAQKCDVLDRVASFLMK